MQKLSILKKGITLVIALAVLFVCFLYAQHDSVSKVDASSEDVSVGARVGKDITVDIRPEKRIPKTNNWDTSFNIQIRKPGKTYGELDTYSYTYSWGTSGPITMTANNVPPGTYDIAIRAAAHLREIFPNQVVNSELTQNFDLTSIPLRGGDCHPTADNYVNIMDLSYQATNIYTSEDRSDLNDDGVVNSLDFQILLTNFDTAGEE